MGGVEPGLKADRMPSMARELPGLIFLILAMGAGRCWWFG